jgi:4-aminobutyrate aminotransferase-like enzyme
MPRIFSSALRAAARAARRPAAVAGLAAFAGATGYVACSPAAAAPKKEAASVTKPTSVPYQSIYNDIAGEPRSGPTSRPLTTAPHAPR